MPYSVERIDGYRMGLLMVGWKQKKLAPVNLPSALCAAGAGAAVDDADAQTSFIPLKRVS